MEKKLENLEMIAGRLGKDPVVYTRNIQGKPVQVAKFDLAVPEIRNGKKETVWVKVSAWRERVNAAKLLHKGEAVMLHGKKCVEKYINRAGAQVECPAFDAIWFTFLGKKKQEQEAQAGA